MILRTVGKGLLETLLLQWRSFSKVKASHPIVNTEHKILHFILLCVFVEVCLLICFCLHFNISILQVSVQFILL